jgi:hypothetical protein
MPFWEKLPKDHQFFKHFMQNIGFNQIQKAANENIDRDREIFQEAAEKLER